MAELIDWLTARLHKDESFFGYQRWYEDDAPELLSVRDGKVVMCREGGILPADRRATSPSTAPPLPVQSQPD
ncbi:hypothetical protein [Nonomuraea rubra]|uniref:Uncharacterized protein n=1 Tax=Nonomuraea rubra TaxID=46180 RepID=A0A7X0P1I7_9ACTN|nr:hypothetical protein [Nonomuraea rubra]MBB6553548.1 hypothetical protein [Nonomuraea rubra]